MTEEDKKRRRQEINRQSARRIRERRSHEMERLKQQVCPFATCRLPCYVCVNHLQLMRWCGISIELLTCMQNALLHHQLGQLLKYASSLAREKNVLVQRTMELTERWNQVTVHMFFSCDALLTFVTKSKTSVSTLVCDQSQDQMLNVDHWCHSPALVNICS